MRRMLVKCPNCGGDLEATRMSCTNCETVILARYEPCRFCGLSESSLTFVEDFVRYRGNLREMERELGESYWALRTRLSEVIEELGLEEKATKEDLEALGERRSDILDRLERGEIDGNEAARQLGELSGGA